MIHSHIKQIALSLDENNFQVKLPDLYAHSNETFEDGEDLDQIGSSLSGKVCFEQRDGHRQDQYIFGG